MINPSDRLKKKAYLIIVAAFIIGIVTGSLFMNLVAAKPVTVKKASLIDNLTIELNLSPEQREKVDGVYRDSREQTKLILKTVQPQIDSLRQQTKGRVREFLTPHQREIYDNWCNVKDAERKKTEEKR